MWKVKLSSLQFFSKGNSFSSSVSGKQYVVNSMLFRTRFNNYKSSSRKYSSGISIAQAQLLRHSTEVNHNGFLKDVTSQITNRVFGESRLWEGQKLNSFVPEGLSIRFVDH